jgi:hypothetical protein
MEVTPAEVSARAVKAATERSRSPELVQEGHESATVAEVHLPVSFEQIETVCPQWDPEAYCWSRKAEESQRSAPRESSPRRETGEKKRTMEVVRATM